MEDILNILREEIPNKALFRTFNKMGNEDKDVLNDDNDENKITADLSYLEKVLAEKEKLKNLDINNNIIHEEGEFAGIIVGKTSKEEIILNFNKYNIFYNMMKSNESSLTYDDIGILSNLRKVKKITYHKI